MSAAILIGMTDTILNGNRTAQLAGLGSAFATAMLVNPAAGLAAAVVTLGLARVIGRDEEQKVNAFDMVVSSAPAAQARTNEAQRDSAPGVKL